MLLRGILASGMNVSAQMINVSVECLLGCSEELPAFEPNGHVTFTIPVPIDTDLTYADVETSIAKLDPAALSRDAFEVLFEHDKPRLTYAIMFISLHDLYTMDNGTKVYSKEALALKSQAGHPALLCSWVF